MNVFMARQPIFDAHLQVVAYELLFRSDIENVFKGADVDHASSKVMSDTFLLFGLDTITGGKSAFINMTRGGLVGDLISLFPKDLVVAEILETVRPDAEVLQACRRLKEAGYRIALDDFVESEEMKPLIEMADYVKVDLLITPPEQRGDIARRFHARGIKMLAEKVESQAEFELSRAQGYELFQGYFFSRPIMVSRKDVPGFKLNYIRLLSEINNPDFEFGRVEEIIKQDVSVSYKLLRYINSAIFAFRQEIKSIRDALVLLGESNVRKLASLWILAGMGQDKPQELVVCSILRARFCESLAAVTALRDRQSELFLLGMFSLIDAIMDRPMAEILAQLRISDDVQKALLGEPSPFQAVLDSVLAYERGEWDRCSEAAATLSLDEERIPQIYLKAIEWTGKIFQTN